MGLLPAGTLVPWSLFRPAYDSGSPDVWDFYPGTLVPRSLFGPA